MRKGAPTPCPPELDAIFAAAPHKPDPSQRTHARTHAHDGNGINASYFSATHVMFIDPDWKPIRGTIEKSQLTKEHTNFFFKIHDRNGKTTRILDWLVLQEPNLRMKYRWHEQWVFPHDSVNSVMKTFLLGWEVEERKDKENWHTKSHEDSFSYDRYLFEIGELTQDYEENKDDPRVLYYLGFDHLAALEAASKVDEGKVSEAAKAEHLEKAIFYLKERVKGSVGEKEGEGEGEGEGKAKVGSSDQNEIPWHLYGKSPNAEMSYSSLQFLGIVNWIYKRDDSEAELWYKRCIEFDPTYFRCYLNLSQLYADTSKWREAWDAEIVALEKGKRSHSGTEAGKMENRGDYRAINHEISVICELPLHLVRLADALLQETERYVSKPELV